MVAGLWGLSPGALASTTDEAVFFQEPLTKDSIIRLTNEARSMNGLPGLDENACLDSVAEERARDMLHKQYFAHVSPTGQRASDVALRAGYRYRIIAENIARGLFFTNQKLINRWMRSPGHRKNILLPEVREIGVAFAKGTMNGETVWVGVQVLGLRLSHASNTSCSRVLIAEHR